MKKISLIVLGAMMACMAFALGGKDSGSAAPAAGKGEPGKVVPAVPYPANTVTGVKTVDPKLFSLDQILEYKALPNYSEPDYVTKAVQAGKIPPVKDRLPAEPQVIKTSFMADGAGEYGGVFANVFAVPIEGWNYTAGATPGWFGIESCLFPGLVQTGPTYLRSDKQDPLPSLARSWEWSKDGTQLTFHLIQGAKWSDGAPFSADDVMYAWEYHILDDQVPSWQQRGTFQINGKDTKLEALDKYTVRFTFPEPFPTYLMFLMNEASSIVAPKHIFAQYHPRNNPKMNYADYRVKISPTQLPMATMGPWIPARYQTDQLLILTRNPYYWKVDSNGKQLPYIDEVQFKYATDSAVRTLNTLAGSCDVSNVGETFDEVAKQAANPAAQFKIVWQMDSHGYGIVFNLAEKFGADNDRAKAVRTLFRDKRFRQAVAYLTDREGISKSLASGPFFRAWAGGLLPNSPFFDRTKAVYYPYSVESAKTLLAEMGLKDTDNDGFLNYTSGPLAGKNVELDITAQQDLKAMVDIGQALVNMFSQAGLKLSLRTLTGTARQDLERTGNWELFMRRFDAPHWLVPNVVPLQIVPSGDRVVAWHYNSVTDKDLMPEELRMMELLNQFRVETDFAKQKELINEYNKILTESAWFVGVTTVFYGGLYNANLKNLQPGVPVNIYRWGHDSMFMEQLWFSPDKQKERAQVLPGYIAGKADYKY